MWIRIVIMPFLPNRFSYNLILETVGWTTTFGPSSPWCNARIIGRDAARRRRNGKGIIGTVGSHQYKFVTANKGHGRKLSKEWVGKPQQFTWR